MRAEQEMLFGVHALTPHYQRTSERPCRSAESKRDQTSEASVLISRLRSTVCRELKITDLAATVADSELGQLRLGRR
jgi:hypothetical protein